MAEIRVEQKPKRSLAWLWLLIALALVACAIWYFNNDGVDNVQTTGQTRGQAPIAHPTEVAVVAVVAVVEAPGSWLCA
jgi:hypothetical protein